MYSFQRVKLKKNYVDLCENFCVKAADKDRQLKQTAVVVGEGTRIITEQREGQTENLYPLWKGGIPKDFRKGKTCRKRVESFKNMDRSTY